MVNEILKTDIPDDWDIKKLEPNVGFVRSGKRLPKGYYVTPIPTQHPYIRVADMRPGYVDVEGLMYVPDEAYFWIQKYRIYRDDIYISVAGTLGIVGQIPGYLDGANLTENANRITDIKCNIKFLMYWLMSSKIQGLINQTQTLGAQPKLALTRIRNFPIILPPIEEQRQIAEVLCNVDTLITNLRKLIRKKKDIRQGTMQMLVTGEKRLGNFSGEWFDCTLDSIAYVLNGDRGINYPSGDDFIEYGIPFINAGNISNNIVDVSTVDYISIEKYNSLGGVKIQKNDIIFCLRGSLGKCAISNFTGGAPASSLCVIRAKDGIDARFLFHIINSEITSRQIDNLNAGSSQPNLSAKSLKSFKFIIPKDVAEQEMISNILSDMDLDIYKLEEKLSKYQKIKLGMMDELLTGKVRLV